MEQNPYAAPAVIAPLVTEDQLQPLRRRPIGIWILSGLHLLVGLAFLSLPIIVIGMWLLNIPQAGGVKEPEWLIVGLLCGVSALAIVTGIGLWRGSRWGWWLAAFYYVSSAFSFTFEMPVRIWQSLREDELFAVIAPLLLVRLAIHYLLAAYFFKRSVRAFYRLESLSIVKAIIILLSVTVALFIILVLGIGAYVFATRSSG